jgi:poly-beta-1,6-N-acetyl-D-glucosamine synthase
VTRRTLPQYVVVTPVRDEARHVVATVRSMRAQAHPPALWVIVDDGSTDATPRLLREATAGAAWIRVVATGSTERRLGSAEVLAFQRGVAEIPPDAAYEYIVKLDGDLDLPADYFARLLRRMEADPRWGIASGRYCEWHDGAWVPIAMPPYHAAGASKVLRRACFEQGLGHGRRDPRRPARLAHRAC